MSDPQRQIRLGAFIMATGHHVAAWRHPDAEANAGHDIDHYRALAETAERGKFDLVFVADSPAGWDADRDREVRSRLSHSAHFEPVTLWSALSQVTSHVGFVATASTTYEDPYLLARKFASLDHISKGRAAWNVVTTAADVSKNFSIAGHPAHANRYERAEEVVDLVLDLWDSYEDDAIVIDKESGVFLDPDKVHLTNHKGKYFSVTGPLNVARSPRGARSWSRPAPPKRAGTLPPAPPRSSSPPTRPWPMPRPSTATSRDACRALAAGPTSC